jgi:hypothetical protein
MVLCPHCNKEVPISNKELPISNKEWPISNKGLPRSNSYRTSSDPNSPLGTFAATREGPFPDKKCPHCGEIKSQEFYSLQNVKGRDRPWRLRHCCRECDRVPHRARSIAWYKRKLQEFETAYEEWCRLSEALPNKPLNEEQWLATIKFFKGCALCNEPHVETREFFQKSTSNGAYTAWNVIPMCGKCSTLFRTIENPFKLYSTYRTFGMDIPKEKLERLVGYMMSKMQEATNEHFST